MLPLCPVLNPPVDRKKLAPEKNLRRLTYEKKIPTPRPPPAGRPLPRAPPQSRSGSRGRGAPASPTAGLLLAPPLRLAPPWPLEPGKPWPELGLEVPAAVSCSFCPAASPPELAVAPTSAPHRRQLWSPPPPLQETLGRRLAGARRQTMDALVVCDGCSSHVQARVGAASSSSCPPAATLPVPHCRLPVITGSSGPLPLT
ncbi:basic proline-rich protein-like [Triticum urartu]|uniref:basic proline-rich protein-like n=1 Tax=Triticum urartu TaxID=4572 RepID=UPI0020442479|nr:basic proline-rich protein-like [Triticum urartu]XP_048547303.1 basic proline-rich protein-like [Triticum urartu]